MGKLRAGILGATGMVGQRFVSLLEAHSMFEVTVLAASPRSAGKPYLEAVRGRWHMAGAIPARMSDMTVFSVGDDLQKIAGEVDIVFCALDLDKDSIRQIEEDYAAAGVAVISNNSAHRWTKDVPILIPEVNPDHARIIEVQRKKRGWTTGLIAVKPNCSVQSYVPVLSALWAYEPQEVMVTSLQAISGAGRTFDTWPEMVDNVNPYIAGEEDKSEEEPLKIWGRLSGASIVTAPGPVIEATCIRVPVSDGHLASVTVRFGKSVTKEQIIAGLRDFANPLSGLNLPSAPAQFISYLSEADRPQTKLDRDREHGMGITVGRLRETSDGRWQFVSLSHNTIRGAAGGAILMGELLVSRGYVVKRS